MKTNLFKRVTSLLVCFTIILSVLQGMIFNADAATEDSRIVVTNKVADPSTNDWEKYFGPNKMDTEFAGGVWTDKSVYAQATDELPGVTMVDKDNFLVALSAIASNLSITGYSSSPTDTMLILDLSGSMVNDTELVGYTYNRYRYNSVYAIDMSLIEAMVDATNDTIDRLMKQNSNNRVGLVLFSGNLYSGYVATADTATTVLPLGRYTGVDGKYLAIDTNYTTERLYQRNGNNYTLGSEITYVDSDEEVYIETVNGVKNGEGVAITAARKQAVGSTYIQNGLYHAMKQFLAVTDKVVPEGRPQAGAERQPVIVLMSDGAPTVCTSDYSGTDGTDANIGDSNYGSGSSSQDVNTLNRIAVMTQLTAAYVRGRVAAHYQESENDSKDITFLTLGLGTSADDVATATLYPSGSSNNIKNIWNTYLAVEDGEDVTLKGNGFSGSATVRRYSEVESINYVDKYFYADNSQQLIESFDKIVSEIELKAQSYATLIEGDSADLSGYITFEDELGEMMEVADMKGVLMSDGNGGTVLYTGKGIAQGMTNGNLGSVENPTARGDELVRTVRERIPGLDTSMAQRLIGNAYNDKQLYYANDSDWSNYIGWYADQNGNYIGFWDKDSGYKNAPEGAVYANRSYGYLGVQGDTDMMHVVVLVRTELKTLHQTVFFKIPASLIPTVRYKVTINEENPNKVDEFIREDALPMQLVFEVGLRSDVNSVNLNKKIEEHLAAGGHIHRNNDGTVTFYTNEWAIGNDTNNNGIPDPSEVETAKVAESHFHPAMDNSRYYYTDDTPILDASGNPVGGTTRPNGNYFHTRNIYNKTEKTTITMPVAADTLLNKAQYDAEKDQWYIPAGTIFSEVARFKVDKVTNTTKTLAYSNYPAVFENGYKQDVYSFLGNNGAITVSPAQGIALTKIVSELNDDPNAPSEFTFEIVLNNAVSDPLITDTDGNELEGISSVNGNVITVTLTAGQTVVISGLPTGTAYTVTEVETEYYKSASVNATGIVEAYTVNKVDFVNTAKHYGNLIIAKDVNYPEGFAPGTAHNSKEFTINVTFEGDTGNMLVPQGVVKNGDTYTLKLKDGDSVTFAGIPEGVTYTVAETDLPDGYTTQDVRYNDINKTVDGNDIDVVSVVNAYNQNPTTAKLKIQGTKTVVGGWPTDAEFTVRLWQSFDFASGEVINTNRTATVNSGNSGYTIDISDIEFDKVGTYYIRVAEDIPEDATRIPDMAYDRTVGLFSITVTDDDADGNLEVKDGAVVGYQGTPVSGNATDGWLVTKDFTNVVTKDIVYLDIEKSLTGYNGTTPPIADITFGLFDSMTAAVPSLYSLTDKEGKATLMIPVTKEDIDNNDGQLVYYLREVAPDVANRVVGMHYNENWIYAVRITWNENANVAVTEYAPISNNVVGTYSSYVRGQVVFTHTNTYQENVDVKVELSGTKTLNGKNELGSRRFNFSLYNSTAAFVKGTLIETVPNNGNDIAFSSVSFTAPGIYYMVAEEDATTLGGITIDPTVYHITVEVEKFVDTDGIARLRVVSGYPTVVAYGTTENVGVNGLNFNNTYTVTGSQDVVIQGLKKLEGKILNANEYQFGLYRDAQCEDTIESVYNRADGTFSFKKLTFNAADLGADYATKTYTYYVKEINDGKAGITYDDTVFVVNVVVEDNNEGRLNVITTAALLDGTPLDIVENNVVNITVRNVYTAQPVETTINGSKNLSGDWTAVPSKLFRFELYTADFTFGITDTTPIKTESVDGNGNFSMTLEYADGEEGIHYYVLKEDISNKLPGISYDAGEYHITVNVSDPGNGQLVANVTMYRPGVGNMTEASFNNRYSVTPIEIVLRGDKQYSNSVTGQPITQIEGMFGFSVLENDVVVATGKNLADGSIQFTPITYTAAGTHEYIVVENAGDAGGVIYDDTVFTVIVTVTDNGDGTLTAEADYVTNEILFKNYYTHNSAQVLVDGEKMLSGDWSAVSNLGKQFTFELYKTDALYTITGTPVDIVTSEAGAFSFGAQTFTEPGVYYFAVCEFKGDFNGVEYDETVYHIEITVIDDGQGNLIPTVSGSEPTLTVVTDATNVRIITVSGLEFTNTYEAAPAKYTPEAVKEYEGGSMRPFDFVLTVNGNDEQTKQNDSNGRVVFDELTFETAGVYTLTIREQISTLIEEVRWDVNVYTITLYVEDDGMGRLLVNESMTEIISDKGRNDLIFRNAHHDIITNKEVFVSTDPTVNIDGKSVEKGAILIYEISYKNFDSVPLNVEIVDTIPQYTEYVEGSADNGATFSGDTIKWVINNVAPDQTVTVSFKVMVVGTEGTITNSAKVIEGNNEYQTKEVVLSVKEDTIVKDVFHDDEPTVSIDGEKVKKDDVLLYTITYKNSDDVAAEVTITDNIPKYTEYVEGSADNNGVFDTDKLTWTLTLSAGQSKTVSFKVKVTAEGITIENEATGTDGKQELTTNKVVNTVPTVPSSPPTGDNFNLTLWVALFFVCGGTIVTLAVVDKKRRTTQQ